MTTTSVIYDPKAGVGTLADIREGDRVEMEVLVDHEWRAVTGPAFTRKKSGNLLVGGSIVRHHGGDQSIFTRVLRATREVPPLPTTPGDVIGATVRGVPDSRVFYSSARGGVTPWFSAVPIKGRYWHSAEDITAWEPIAVQEVIR